MNIFMQTFKNMKRLFLTIILVIGCSVAFAQEQPKHKGHRPNFEKFLKDRVSFVTHAMELDAADSVKFVPLYLEMLKEKGELMFKRPRQRIRPDQEYPDSVYTKAAESEIEFNFEDAKIEKKYLHKFQEILTPKQVFSWIQAEKKFIGSFMQKGRGHRQEAQK